MAAAIPIVLYDASGNPYMVPVLAPGARPDHPEARAIHDAFVSVRARRGGALRARQTSTPRLPP